MEQEKYSVFETLLLFKDKRVLMLFPSVAYSGLSAAYINVIYPKYVGTNWIGYSLIVYGVAEVVGSIAGGKASDKIGRTPVFIASCIATAAGVLVASLSSYQLSNDPKADLSTLWMYFVAYFLLGLGDSGFNTQVQSALGYFKQDSTQAAFAYYRMVLSVFAAIGSISGKYIQRDYLAAPWDILLPSIVLWVSVCIALVSWIILDCCIAEVSPKKKKTFTLTLNN